MRMRESRFWELMDDEFGSGYAQSVASSQSLTELGGLTARAALDAGVPPQQVWAAVCGQMSVPDDRRFGRDLPPREPRPQDV